MTILRIYKLDSDGDAVSNLQEGKHVIGRGPLLQCEDRRVSRNHGIIIVTQDVATITSTHINPCFYQAAAGKTITILKKDNPMHLSDGDKFALLADQFWYKIKLEKAKELTNGTFNNTSVDVTDNKLLVVKREAEEDQSPTCSKKIKIEMDNDTTIVGQKENFENVAKAALNVKIENEEQENGTGHNSLPKTIKRGKEVMSSSESDTPSSSNKKNVKSNKNKIENEEQENPSGQNSLPKSIKREKEVMSSSESDTPSSSTKKKAKSNENKTTLSAEAALHEAKIKNLLFSSDEDDVELKTQSNNKATNSKQNVKKIDDVNKNKTIKQKDKNERIDDDQVPGCGSSTDDTNKAGPSDTSKQQHRDRCWYGMGCYRKNQAHLKEYSHPGDSDFESDPKDDRPECSFGAGCYRRNKKHREEYKHPRNIQKPPNKRTKNNATPKQKRPRKQQYYKDTPEDDYDLEDPFINDSGSEFEVYSDSEDSDSDFSGGSEEETKRLLKEAKRFTKEKKKDDEDD